MGTYKIRETSELYTITQACQQIINLSNEFSVYSATVDPLPLTKSSSKSFLIHLIKHISLISTHWLSRLANESHNCQASW